MMLTPRQRSYLQVMGIDVYLTRDPHDVPLDSQWAALRAQVSACQRCELHKGRTQTVFGVGDAHADWLVIGEAPGVEEDRQGEPFVGPAGQLLDKMLLAIDLPRERVFIANVLKCRPPQNRDPKPEEAKMCADYLRAQIGLIQPKIILIVGRIAAQHLLETEEALASLRGRRHVYAGIPVVVTYHPAYLLRDPRQKRKAWDDLKFAVRVYEEQA